MRKHRYTDSKIVFKYSDLILLFLFFGINSNCSLNLATIPSFVIVKNDSGKTFIDGSIAAAAADMTSGVLFGVEERFSWFPPLVSTAAFDDEVLSAFLLASTLAADAAV
eukprot:Sdes_comp25285_c0_seq1m22724